MPCGESVQVADFIAHLQLSSAYRWHDRLSILANNVTEWHLGALIRVCPDLWVVDVLNLLDWDCIALAAALEQIGGSYSCPERRFS